MVIAAGAGVAAPGPGRRADAGGAILGTLAILVFCTGSSMTFREIAAIRAASRRLILVLALTTVTLPALAWLASQLVTGAELRGGVLAAGIAPAEVASVALTGLAGGEVAIAGAHSSASQLGLLATLALVVALPLAAGSAMRTLDPLNGREQPLLRVLGTTSLRDFAIAAGIATSAFGAAAAAAPLGIYGILVLVFGTAAAYAARSHGGRPRPT